VLDQRRGLLVVDREPPLDRGGVVVRAVDQRRAVDVAEALALGRVEGQVVLVAVRGADPPAADALDQQLVGHVDEHGARLAVRQLRVERPRLLDRPREAVEHELVLGVDGLHQQLRDDPVGHELAPVHVPLQLGALSRRGAQQIPRREVGHVALGRQRLRLRSLPRTRRAEQHQIAHGS